MTKSARRLRVAVLNRTFSPAAGGAERYSIALVEKLAARHDIHVFAQSIDHQWPGVNYHRVSMPLHRPRWMNQLWFATATWWATRKGFDVVHSHENTWHGQIQTVHVLPVKHNLFHDSRGWRRWLRVVKVVTSPRLLTYLWLERMRYAVNDGRAIVVISETLRTFFVNSYPDAAAMTSILTPGIDLPNYPVNHEERMSAREQLGLPLNKRCILFVGNDFRKKGLDVLLEAMQGLPDDVVLAIVGESAQRVQFQELAVRLGLSPRVFFLGAMKEIGPAYRAADALVHPTLEDTFAMVVLEAMAYGLPVVVSSSRYCGIAGFLSHDVNAVILDSPRDAASLSASVRRLLDDPSLRETMGFAARSFAGKFEWDGIALTQEAMYETVASSAPGFR